ncbi:MAG: sulfatase [Myxococcota bacterium]|nr:sulfatase [Myxococcota bacterium]
MDWNLLQRYLEQMGSPKLFDRWPSTAWTRGHRRVFDRRNFTLGPPAKLLPGLGLVVLSMVLAACGPDSQTQRIQDPRPNVLFISVDTIRADHLSAYGYGRETSPFLSGLARDGVQVQAAYAPSATTGPTHASVFTAQPPMAHGVRKNGQPLPENEKTLAERLSEIGFETGAVVSSYVLSDRFGYGQGFDSFDDDFSKSKTPVGSTLWEGETIEERFYGRADDTTDRALRWLDERSDEAAPFFLFVHYYDPHDPYVPPENFTPPFAPGRKESLKLNRTIYLYDWLIAYTDQQIGRLLEGLDLAGLAEDTLVIVTGDHGEGLMTHGHMFHGVHVYEEAVKVPLILRWPGHLPQGLKVEGPFPLVELAPALLELIGDSPNGPLASAGSASRLLGRGESADEEIPIFLYRRHYADPKEGDGPTAPRGEKFGVRLGGWKLIVGPAEGTLELYGLVDDPLEQINLASEEPERVARLSALIDAWRLEHERNVIEPAPVLQQDRERLKALGYVE